MLSIASKKRVRSASQFLLFTSLLLIFHRPVCYVSCFRQLLVQSRPPPRSFVCNLCRCRGAVSPGDTVVVFGATGGIGQLVTRKLLLNGYNVRAVARNATAAASVLCPDITEATKELPSSQRGILEIEQLSLLDTNNEEALRAALQNASGVVLSLGTTAFPTKKWNGGNTPNAIDNLAIRRVSNALLTEKNIPRKVVLVTSVGVKRTKDFPFFILNLFGVLDAKRSGEEAIQELAAASGGMLDYAIVRPGRLVGGPYTNLDLAKLMQIEGGSGRGVIIAEGDTLLGDCKRDACAEAVVQCLKNVSCKNIEFSIVSSDENNITDSQWADSFLSMRKHKL